MDYVALHDWNVTPSAAIVLQKQFAGQVRLVKPTRAIRFVAGADISFERFSDTVHAGFVVYDLEKKRVVDEVGAMAQATFPYVSGLLSFREIPPLIEAWKKLGTRPDAVMMDGQGIAHPRRLGIASHFGLVSGLPTLGCGKSLLCGSFERLDEEAGQYAPLVHRGEQVGVALRTRARVSPVFISPGHLMDFDTAREIAMRSCGGYRIPEPTRQAHLFVNRLRVEARPKESGGSLTA